MYSESCSICEVNIKKHEKELKLFKNKEDRIRVLHEKKKDRIYIDGLYLKWRSMRTRIKYPSQYGYKWYGGKGIGCDWSNKNDFIKDMIQSYTDHVNIFGFKETTLDRIDNDKNYSKDNCRWATRFEQTQNKRILKNNIEMV